MPLDAIISKISRSKTQSSAQSAALEIAYRPPFDWTALLSFLADRTIEGMEAVEGNRYQRTVSIVADKERYEGWIELQPLPGRSALRMQMSTSLYGALSSVRARVQHLIDANCNPEEVARVLGPLAARNPGLRVPGAMDGFELAVRAILGQQITVRAARTLAGRFAEAFGERIDTPFDQLRVVFPRPDRIARCRLSSVARLGIVATRAQAIIGIARKMAMGKLFLQPDADVDATLKDLQSIRGVGAWTAQYIAMRALAWPDAFPHSDLALLKALKVSKPRQALELSEAWRPWRAYAVMHLWNALKDAQTSAGRR